MDLRSIVRELPVRFDGGRWSKCLLPPDAMPAVRDSSDYVLYVALALLPVDGLKIGFSMPYWNPISPVLFALYVAMNRRFMARVVQRFPFWFLMSAALIPISLFGWMTVAFHPWAAIVTFAAIALGLCCLAALDIALRLKRLPVRGLITVLALAYWCSFLVGVVEFISIKAHLEALHGMFIAIMQRNYVAVRVQFLFAEPSYIGMHLYGVLLPVYWLTRDRRLALLIPCFAIGSIAMGAGSRIIVDTVVAGLASSAILIPWKRLGVAPLIRRIAGTVALTIVLFSAALTNPRFQSIWEHGPWNGDISASARLFRSFSPLLAGLHDLPHLVLGFGAGNLSEAMQRGYPYTIDVVRGQGGSANKEIRGLDHAGAGVFSMDAYVSILAEFGLIVLAFLAVALVRRTLRHRGETLTVAVWLLTLAYLYAQFEAYAFYAFWLFVWYTGTTVRTAPTTVNVHDSSLDAIAHMIHPKSVTHLRQRARTS